MMPVINAFFFIFSLASGSVIPQLAAHIHIVREGGPFKPFLWA